MAFPQVSLGLICRVTLSVLSKSRKVFDRPGTTFSSSVGIPFVVLGLIRTPTTVGYGVSGVMRVPGPETQRCSWTVGGCCLMDFLC